MHAAIFVVQERRRRAQAATSIAFFMGSSIAPDPEQSCRTVEYRLLLAVMWVLVWHTSLDPSSLYAVATNKHRLLRTGVD